MNCFGEFLYALRKEKGMTQAQLAQELGVTNKAVSKWETGEAMPETALLLPISRIFGVSVDELLDGKRSHDKADNNGTDKVGDIKRHMFTRGKYDNNEKTLSEILCGSICAAVVFCGLTVYFMIGIFSDMWSTYWVIIPSCAMLSGIIGIIFDVCNARKRQAKIAKGENPYVGAVCGIIMISGIIAYFISGALTGLWHPLWIILILSAFVCALTAMTAEIIMRKNK